MNNNLIYLGNIFNFKSIENYMISQQYICGANLCISFVGPGCQWNACVDHSAYCNNNLCHNDSTNDYD